MHSTGASIHMKGLFLKREHLGGNNGRGRKGLVLDELDGRGEHPPTAERTSGSTTAAAGAGKDGNTPAPTRRQHRQWGAERPRPPLPIIEEPAGHAATWMGGLAITVTALAWMTYIARTVLSEFIDHGL